MSPGGSLCLLLLKAENAIFILWFRFEHRDLDVKAVRIAVLFLHSGIARTLNPCNCFADQSVWCPLTSG